MDKELLNQLETMALEIAHAAGRFLVQERPAALEVDTKTSQTDVVTQMDKAAESLIVQKIKQSRPDDLFIGEEGTVNNSPNPTNVQWIVDPIDGTVNYLHQHPFWSVSIGVQVAGITQVGVVYAPILKETYFAVKDKGAYLINDNGKTPVTISRNTDLATTLVATGFSYESEKRIKHGNLISELSGAVRDFRRDGSAAIDLCMVGLGRVDAYFETGLHPWDFTAGALFVEEAGGKTCGLKDQPISNSLAIAANAGVFNEFANLIQTLHEKNY